MLTLTINCSNHQEDDKPRRFSMTLETIDDVARQRIEHHLRQDGWVVRYTGDFMYAYCSKKCAEVGDV